MIIPYDVSVSNQRFHVMGQREVEGPFTLDRTDIANESPDHAMYMLLSGSRIFYQGVIDPWSRVTLPISVNPSLSERETLRFEAGDNVQVSFVIERGKDYSNG